MRCKGIASDRVGYEQSGVGNGQGARMGWVGTDFLLICVCVCVCVFVFLAVLLSSKLRIPEFFNELRLLG